VGRICLTGGYDLADCSALAAATVPIPPPTIIPPTKATIPSTTAALDLYASEIRRFGEGIFIIPDDYTSEK
jgi:hypothetical protein